MRFFSDNAAPVHPRVLAAMADANTLDTAYDGDALVAGSSTRGLSELFETEVARAVGADRHRRQLPRARRAVPAARRRRLPPRRAYPERRGRRARILHPRRQAAAGRRRRREADPGRRSPRCSTRSRDDVHRSSRTRSRSPTRPNMAWSTRPTRSPRSARCAQARGLGLHMDGARFANAVAHLGCSPADVTWRAGVDALSLRLRQERRDERRGAGVLPARAGRRDAATAASAPGCCCRRGAISPRRSWRCSTTTCGSTTRAPPTPARALLARGGGRPAGPPGRGERGVPARHRRRGRGAARAGLRLLRLGARARSGW